LWYKLLELKDEIAEEIEKMTLKDNLFDDSKKE